MLIVIEGLDGAGKRTLTQGLQAALEAEGRSVTTLAFPRYGQSVTADLAAEALHGGHGDLADSVYAMAVLFALDRAGAKDQLASLTAGYTVCVAPLPSGSYERYLGPWETVATANVTAGKINAFLTSDPALYRAYADNVA